VIRAFSYGGGVQSTAALVLAAERRIDFPLLLFANVGADSENPATLDYVETVAKPYAVLKGISLVEVQKIRRTGEVDTIRTWLDRTPKSIGIPMRMANGAPGNRSCTEQFKINVINKELKRRGATAESPAILGMGISMDEWQRMRTDSGGTFKTLAYPLIDMGVTRQDCVQIIARAGLPVPPKSSCYFCPFKRTGEWQKMRRDEPALFALSVTLEEQMNVRRVALGRDPVFLSSRAIPLIQVVGDHDQLDMFEGGCDIAGYCHV
jgi:3'-phosphoadenosine 5'-phosphosulfate sulfotransferase (PAPS reductase)/FAD synthetase